LASDSNQITQRQINIITCENIGSITFLAAVVCQITPSQYRYCHFYQPLKRYLFRQSFLDITLSFIFLTSWHFSARCNSFWYL